LLSLASKHFYLLCGDFVFINQLTLNSVKFIVDRKRFPANESIAELITLEGDRKSLIILVSEKKTNVYKAIKFSLNLKLKENQ